VLKISPYLKYVKIGNWRTAFYCGFGKIKRMLLERLDLTSYKNEK
jgi:hypothetical protein